MTVSASACSAVVLNQQQQTIQHHEHCDQAKCDSVADANASKSRGTIAGEPPVPKQCTVVEHGRVVVKDILPTGDVDSTEDCQAADHQ
ncbi:MAG: hypothetical protein ACAF41_10395 [Leptolyngbya sp. BL-A-14]